eukprot:1151015-Pelagomonas_calceolata.AAC.1
MYIPAVPGHETLNSMSFSSEASSSANLKFVYKTKDTTETEPQTEQTQNRSAVCSSNTARHAECMNSLLAVLGGVQTYLPPLAHYNLRAIKENGS